MIGGFLFIQHSNAHKGMEYLSFLGPQKAKFAHENITDNIYCGQMGLSLYENVTVAKANECYLVGTAFLNNRKELAALLNCDSNYSDQQIILLAFLKHGKNCMNFLQGQFAFIIYNNQNKSVFGCNSASGGGRLLYHFKDGNIIAASEAKCILPFLNNRTLNKEFIISYLQGVMLESENSAYNDVFHLPHGCAFSFENGKFKKWTYYIPGQIKPIRFKKEDEYYEAANALISKVISGYLDHNLTPGIQMGGGLSSSQIAWNLRQFCGKNVNAVSYVLPENYQGHSQDEKHLTDILKHELELNLHYVNEPSFPEPFGDHLEKKFWEQDSMQANPIGSDHEVVYGKLKELGTKLIFTSGGKNFNWFGADVYSYWLFNFNWLEIIRRKAIKKSIAYSLPLSLHSKLIKNHRKTENSILNSNLISREDAEKMEHHLIKNLPHKFAYTVGGPDQLQKIAQWTYGMKKYMSAQERRYDVAFVNPLHDSQLLDFSVSIPTEMHLHRNFGRRLLVGKVPDTIYNNKLPFSYPADMAERWWNLKQHLKEHFESIPANDEVWEYVDRKKMLEKYQQLQNNSSYSYWISARNQFSNTIVLSRFLKWQFKITSE